MSTEGVPVKDGLYGAVPESLYHADRASLSSSGARLLLPPSVPAKFKAAMDKPPKPKRVYDFGHAAHKLVLGKGMDLVEIEAPDYRTKAAQEARDKAHANDKAPVLTAELEKARAMAEKVHQHPRAGDLLKRGHAEVSLYATDPATGTRLRGRLDWTTLIDDRLWVIDYKSSTTADPEAFKRKGADYFYHAQGAWYRDLAIALDLSDNPVFVNIVQEKEPPFLVSVVEWDADAIAEGRRLNRRAIDLYTECTATDYWPSYPGTDDVVAISLPPWAFHRATINDLLEGASYDDD
jgi:hypothetical protein